MSRLRRISFPRWMLYELVIMAGCFVQITYDAALWRAGLWIGRQVSG